jgi:hypothetical protein
VDAGALDAPVLSRYGPPFITTGGAPEAERRRDPDGFWARRDPSNLIRVMPAKGEFR